MVPVEPFPILDVSDWDLVADETTGDEVKYWLQRQGSTVRWLFKEITVKDGRVQGEDWSEKAVSHLAELLRIPCAQVEVAVLRGRAGCISADLRPASYQLQHGQNLLEECPDVSYVHGTGKNHPDHTLENIRAGLEGALPPPDCSLPFAGAAYDVFAGYVLMDAWVGNRDRHDNNWAMLRPLLESDEPRRLCGSYDHASSLGFNLTDQEREQRLGQGTVEAWCKKGTAWRYGYDRRTTLVQLAALGLQLASADARRYWFEKLRGVSEDDVRDVIARVPRMSDLARIFAETVLSVNRRRLLDVCA
ncbi:MAG: hypothetical protein ACRDOI_12925 [Trebonia sp.]